MPEAGCCIVTIGTRYLRNALEDIKIPTEMETLPRTRRFVRYSTCFLAGSAQPFVPANLSWMATLAAQCTSTRSVPASVIGRWASPGRHSPAGCDPEASLSGLGGQSRTAFLTPKTTISGAETTPYERSNGLLIRRSQVRILPGAVKNAGSEVALTEPAGNLGPHARSVAPGSRAAFRCRPSPGNRSNGLYSALSCADIEVSFTLESA